MRRLTNISASSASSVVNSFSYTLDSTGRRTKREDTAGTWNWGYDGESSRVLSESLSGASYPSEVSYTYHTNLNYELASVSLDPTHRTEYFWEKGRLTNITAIVGGQTNVFDYEYVANSDLLKKTTYQGGTVTVHRTYDLLDRLLQISASNTASAAINSFAYTLDSTGRRTQRQDVDGARTDWGYDSFDQLTSASRTNGPNGAFDAAYQYQYQYDLVGNRLHEDRGQLDLDGTFNPLNQLTHLDWGGKLDILGSVTNTNGVAVVVSGYTSAPPFYATNFLGGGVVNNPGSNTIPIVTWQGTNSTQTNMIVYMPPVKPQALLWDKNGNLTNDGDVAYFWDEENRLVGMEFLTGEKLRSEYVYDAQSRRVRKLDLCGWTNGAFSVTNDTRFVYDGWNLVCEIQHSNIPTFQSSTNYYVWGLDLSQSLQGAGGIGGLLCVVRNGVPYYPVYCANGNISDYVDESGTVVAHREYDPFGRTVLATGPMAESFSFWFSTKYYEPAWGLCYFGYRWYSPNFGRWASRDLVGILGGPNAYGYVRNCPAMLFDALGLQPENGPPADAYSKVWLSSGIKVSVQSETVHNYRLKGWKERCREKYCEDSEVGDVYFHYVETSIGKDSDPKRPKLYFYREEAGIFDRPVHEFDVVSVWFDHVAIEGYYRWYCLCSGLPEDESLWDPMENIDNTGHVPLVQSEAEITRAEARIAAKIKEIANPGLEDRIGLIDDYGFFNKYAFDPDWAVGREIPIIGIDERSGTPQPVE